MLTVRDEQVEAFEVHLFEAMQRHVEQGIAAAFPELPNVSQVVQRGIENAAEYDISDASDFAAFIALGLALRVAPPGAAWEWIYAYFSRPQTPGAMRLRMIESRLRSLAEEQPAFALIAQRIAKAREGASQ